MSDRPSEKSIRYVKLVTRYLFATLFVGAGLTHFCFPEFYLKIVPPYIPWHQTVVDVSGVAEILLGAMLMFSDLQRIAAWGLILLLIAVFPANIYVYQHQELIPGSPLVHLLRLPLQGVLILWAYWYTRPNRPREAQSSATSAPTTASGGSQSSSAAR
ncbi:MAG TPA: MauE/DoxX family redox-associated membrane protein [Planctomycetaceae bacterium]|nr:MauE/DoxX family redox-associated membrane protein [Planctomycetaceae bacterium]